jgi:hypothetical protein
VTNNALPAGISLEPGVNSFSLRVLPNATLFPTSKAVNLEINSPSTPLQKPAKITLTITDKAVTAKVALSGKIDIASPQSVAIAKLTLANTAATPITSVTLTDPERKGYFEAFDYSANSFKIRVRPGQRPSPGVKYNYIQALIAFENGDSRTETLAITPSQTVGKAFQNKKEVTLYKGTPLAGEQITLNLTTPAGVKLGDVILNQKSVDALKLGSGGFKLERNGENSWVVKFDGAPPMPLTGPAKPSYTVKLELWAEGTYEPNPDGSFKDCLKDSNGNAKSKPTLVSLKVNVK